MVAALLRRAILQAEVEPVGQDSASQPALRRPNRWAAAARRVRTPRQAEWDRASQRAAAPSLARRRPRPNSAAHQRAAAWGSARRRVAARDLPRQRAEERSSAHQGAAVRDSARQRVPVWDLASQWVAGRDLAIRLAEAVALGWANHQAEAASQG
ncbi:hypothetical protein GCM10022251_60440 [Phytohabitans flavus]